MKRFFLVGLVLLIATLMPVQAGDGSVRHTASRHVPNSYVVVLRDDIDADSVGAELARNTE